MGDVIFLFLWGIISRIFTSKEDMHELMCEEATEFAEEQGLIE